MRISVAQVAVAYALHIGVSHGTPSKSAEDSLLLATPADVKSAAKIIANTTMSHYGGGRPDKTPGLIIGSSSQVAVWSSVFWPAILDYWHYTGDAAYNDDLMKSILAQRGPKNDFWPVKDAFVFTNAEVGAWAHVAMGAAEFKFPDPPRDQPQWVQLADNAFRNLTSQWDSSDACGGGIRISPDQGLDGNHWKDATTNGYIFNLAARLGRYTGNQTYTDWADKVWTWMEKVKLITADGDVMIGVNIARSPDCGTSSTETLSADNAVFAAGAAAMYNLTNGDAKWKKRLSTVLDAGITRFFPSETGVLTEMCQSDACTLPYYWAKSRTMPLYAATVKMAPFTEDKLMPLIRKSGEDIAGRCLDNKGFCPPWDTGRHKTGKFAAQNDVAGLGAVSALLVNDAPAPVTKKSGGTSILGGKDGKANADGGKDSGAPASRVGTWVLFLVAASTGLGCFI